ncbi:hypothetical protein NQ315_006558, partial [Exocentrus adspersus]
ADDNSVYGLLVKYAQKDDKEQFFKYTRMAPDLFDYLLSLIECHLQKDPIKNPVSPNQRLAITLHYLSEGCSMQELAWNNYIGKTTVHCIIKETCRTLWTVLQPLVLPEPTREQLKNVALQNLFRWNLPNCCGSCDGKHVQIQCPKHSGSSYFSYKKSFSMILMAACDSYYKFTYVDIGAPGSDHDSAVFRKSSYSKALLNGTLPLPHPQPLPDAAFPLHKNVMRPYSGKYLEEKKNIFNYRLSRCRRTIENTFKILLAQRWRRLRNPIIASEEICELVIMATVVLHNFLQKGEQDMEPSERMYSPTGFVDWEDDTGNIHLGHWRRDPGTNLRSIGRLGSNNASTSVQKLRLFS